MGSPRKVCFSGRGTGGEKPPELGNAPVRSAGRFPLAGLFRAPRPPSRGPNRRCPRTGTPSSWEVSGGRGARRSEAKEKDELGPRGKTKGRPLGRRDESRKFFKARTKPDCGLTVLKVCLGVTLNTAPTALKTKTSGVVYLVTIYASLTHGVLAGTQSTSSPAPPNHSAISRSADSTESLP